MKLIGYIVHQAKRIRASYKSWRTVQRAIDPHYIQYKEVRYDLDRISDDIVPEKEKLKDKKTYPYYLNIETRFGKIKKQFFRTREEADDAMRDHLANKICAWVIKQ